MVGVRDYVVVWGEETNSVFSLNFMDIIKIYLCRWVLALPPKKLLPHECTCKHRLSWAGRRWDHETSRMSSSHCFSISWVLKSEQNITHHRIALHSLPSPCNTHTTHTPTYTCTLTCTQSCVIHLWVMVWTKTLPFSGKKKKKHGVSRTSCLSGLCSLPSYMKAPAHAAPGMWPPWRFQDVQSTLLPPDFWTHCCLWPPWAPPLSLSVALFAELDPSHSPGLSSPKCLSLERPSLALLSNIAINPFDTFVPVLFSS